MHAPCVEAASQPASGLLLHLAALVPHPPAVVRAAVRGAPGKCSKRCVSCEASAALLLPTHCATRHAVGVRAGAALHRPALGRPGVIGGRSWRARTEQKARSQWCARKQPRSPESRALPSPTRHILAEASPSLAEQSLRRAPKKARRPFRRRSPMLRPPYTKGRSCCPNL